MILEEIRRKTSAQHKRLEESRVLSKIVTETLTKEEYIFLIKKFYGFIVPLEKKLGYISSLQSYIPDMEKRLKTPLLQKDLLNISSPTYINQIPFCTNLPKIECIGEAFGYLYVIEGSTLGGKIISDKLHKTFGIYWETGAAYFNNYRDERGFMWKNFINYLKSYPNSGDNDLIVSTAEDTFVKLEQWLNQ